MDGWVMRSKHAEDFAHQGYCTVPISPGQRATLDRMRSMLVSTLRSCVQGGAGLSDGDYLNRFHTFAKPESLNDVRVKFHSELGASVSYRKLMFEIVREYLNDLI